jgi:peptide/nickel transport system substrate-binding protein
MIRRRDYVGASLEGGEIGNPLDSLSRRGESTDFFNFPSWSNDRYDDLVHQAFATTDVDESLRLAKEAAIIIINEAPYIPIAVASSGHFWWPWIKNYYGETNFQDMDIAGIIVRVYLDQVLKKELGY